MFSTLTTAASSSITEPSRRIFVPTWTRTKPTWPQSDLSTGRELEALDALHKCWEIVGPVLELSKAICSEVRSLLDLRSDYLTEREPIIEPVFFGMYMTGRRKDEANPTLLFSCSRVQPRKRAKEVVKQSRILADHPAIRLAHSKRTPQALRPVRLLVGPGKDLVASDPEAFGEVYCLSPVARTCGVPVLVRGKEGSVRKATIGGLVQLGDTYYGLTVAHTFSPDGLDSAPQSNSDISDMECCFDSDGDSSDRGDQENAGDAGRFVVPARSRSRDPDHSEIPSFAGPTTSKPWQRIEDDFASSSIVGNLFQLSTHSGLDWALIAIDEDLVDPRTCNVITFIDKYKERTLWPRALVTTGPAEREILAITGEKGVIQGSLSKSSIYMRTARTRGFQELWTIYMKSNLFEGDCGSWVVDRENGQLYGHIVAGHPGTGVGYIIPAAQIFESVWQTLGDVLILPSRLSSEFNSSLRLPETQETLHQTEYSAEAREFTSASPELQSTAAVRRHQDKLTKELESIFSHENLGGNFNLREHMDDQGFIPIPVLIISIKQGAISNSSLAAHCKTLPFLEMGYNKYGDDYVRKRIDWASYVLPSTQRHKNFSSRSGPAEKGGYRAQPDSTKSRERSASMFRTRSGLVEDRSAEEELFNNRTYNENYDDEVIEDDRYVTTLSPPLRAHSRSRSHPKSFATAQQDSELERTRLELDAYKFEAHREPQKQRIQKERELAAYKREALREKEERRINNEPELERLRKEKGKENGKHPKKKKQKSIDKYDSLTWKLMNPRSSTLPQVDVYRGLESHRDKKPETVVPTTQIEDASDKSIAKVLKRNEKDARRAGNHDFAPLDPSGPFYTRMLRHYLSVETLRYHDIDYKIDERDSDYLLIKRLVSAEEREVLWEHTERLRLQNTTSKPFSAMTLSERDKGGMRSTLTSSSPRDKGKSGHKKHETFANHSKRPAPVIDIQSKELPYAPPLVPNISGFVSTTHNLKIKQVIK